MKKSLSLCTILLTFGFFISSCSKSIAPFQKTSHVIYESKTKSIPVLELTDNEFGQIITKLEEKDNNSNIDDLYVSTTNSFEETKTSSAVISKNESENSKSDITLGNVTPSKLSQITGKNVTFNQIKELKKIQKKYKKENNPISEGGKSQMVALILAIVVGVLGIHRFYLGYTSYGIIQLLTGGGCGIWALIDIIRIATGDLKPKDGDYSEKL